jgi:hypothetical protein
MVSVGNNGEPGGAHMPTTLIDPSYAELADLAGQPMSVVVDDGSTVSLWLECVSTPVSFGGHTSYSIHFTGPATAALGAGEHVLRAADGDFQLNLEPVGRDMRYLHYEAFLTEASVAFA